MGEGSLRASGIAGVTTLRARSGSNRPSGARVSLGYYLKKIGAPDWIRTSDPCLRRAVLYPAELRAQRRGGDTTRRRQVPSRAAQYRSRLPCCFLRDRASVTRASREHTTCIRALRSPDRSLNLSGSTQTSADYRAAIRWTEANRAVAHPTRVRSRQRLP